jgi:rRNA maturation protein Nop10
VAAPEFRSGFERRLAERLTAEGVEFEYEARTFPIIVPTGTKVTCPNCGPVHATKPSRFTPDFFFKNWVIEAKGKFTAKDRKRTLALAATGIPRFGMLFMRDNKLSKSSNTRYTDWCKQHGIPCAVGWFKQEWLT